MKFLSSKIGMAMLLLTCSLLNVNAFGQSITDIKDFKDAAAVKAALNNSYFYAVESMPFKNGKDVQSVKQQLELQLKSALAKKIISNIKVTNSSTKSNTSLNINNNKNSRYTDIVKYEFASKIESKLSFTEPVIQFQEDYKNKMVNGLIAIVKRDFLDQNYSKLKFDLRELSGKVDNVIAAGGNSRLNSIKMNEFLVEKNELYSLISVQNTLDPDRLTDEEFQQNFKELDAKLTSLLSNIESNDFQEALILAKNQVKNIDNRNEVNEHKSAMNGFDLLLVKYPGNSTIIDAKQEALDYIESKYATKISSTDYLEALAAIKTLSQIDQSFIIKHGDMKIQLVKAVFELYIDKAEKNLASKDYNNAKFLLKKVVEYKYYNSTKYDAILTQIDDNIYKQKVYDIDLLISNKKYVEAYRVIIETKTEFVLKNLTGLNEREEKVVDLLTDQKVAEMKKTRPYQYQFQMGAGLISNFYSIQPNTDIVNYQVQTASTTYEFGLYRKVNIKDNFTKTGKDRSRSGAFGIKVSVWVPNQSYSFTNASSTPLQGGLYFKSNIIEPQLSFFTLKIFNLNFGKILGEIIDKDANTVLNSKKDFYTLTFGLRPKIGNLMLNLNAKLISDMEQSNYVTANASLVLALNFGRRFKRYEYDEVHNTILRIKEY